MNKLFLNLKATLIIAVLSLIGTGVLTWSVLSFAQQASLFRTGSDIMMSANNSTNNTLAETTQAVSGDIIEFRVLAHNTSTTVARNVKVGASLTDPAVFANTMVVGGVVSADNATSISDTTTVVVSGSPQALNYVSGHVRIFSPACPSGCAGSDSVVTGNITVGDLGPGESAQVFFKAGVTQVTGGGATPPPSMTCPSVNFVIPNNIQPSSDIQIRVNTSGGNGWAFVTLWKDGSRVPTSAGGDLGGGSFQWTVNSGAAGSVHPLAFRVNDFDAYPGNGSGSGQECGTSSFTTTTPATPPPTTPPSSTPAPQGGSTNNNNNTNNQNSNNTNNNANSNTNNNNNSANATGGTGGSSSSSSSSNSSSSSSVSLTFNNPSPTPSSTTTNTSTTTTRSSVLAQATSTTSAPKVVAVAGNQELTQLPKTGLPLLAWGVAALLPAGFKLKGKKNTQEKSANSVWEERALKV